MDTIDDMIVKILKEETDYRVQGGKAFTAVLKSEYLSSLPDDVRSAMVSHDWNIIYTGTEFMTFVLKFITALKDNFTKLEVIDNVRQGERIVKKAQFFVDNDQQVGSMGYGRGRGGGGGGRGRGRGGRSPRDFRSPRNEVRRAMAYLSITDGNEKTAARYGRLADTCSQGSIVVDGIKYIDLCDIFHKFGRILSPESKLNRDQMEKAATRYRVVLNAAETNNIIQQVDPATYANALSDVKANHNIDSMGIKYPKSKPRSVASTTKQPEPEHVSVKSMPQTEKSVAKSVIASLSRKSGTKSVPASRKSSLKKSATKVASKKSKSHVSNDDDDL